MFTDLDPGLVFIDGKFYNMSTVNNWFTDTQGKFVILDHYSGEKSVIRAGTNQELKRIVNKLDNAMKSLDHGINYS